MKQLAVEASGEVLEVRASGESGIARPAVLLEHTVRTAITVPAWATADQIAEAMEILDPSLEPTGWRGALPGWGATTIYPPPKQSA